MSKYYVSQGVRPPNKGHTVKPAGKSDSARVHNKAEPPCGFPRYQLDYQMVMVEGITVVILYNIGIQRYNKDNN
jgi:hypothetical protein